MPLADWGLNLCFRRHKSANDSTLSVDLRAKHPVGTLASGSECSKEGRRSPPVGTLPLLTAAFKAVAQFPSIRPPLRTLASGSE